jgi:hypothetical protein
MPGRLIREIPRLAAGLTAFVFAATFAQTQAGAVSGAGTIMGFVKYRGAPPSSKPLAVTKDREICGSAPVFDQSLVVGYDGGVTNAVVTIAGVAQGQPPKPQPAVVFDQKRCQYIPHVAVFPAGSTVVILNSDGILHNIHTESAANPVIDLAQPGFKKQIRITIAKPEIIKVTCDAHNWMEGWWYVTDSGYYAISDKYGRYVIDHAPPGTYTLRVWQERLGTQAQRIVVRPGATTVADFTLKSLKNPRDPD